MQHQTIKKGRRTMSEDDAKTKKCSKCKAVKSVTEFQIDKSRNDGRTYLCKVCISRRHKENYQPKPRPPKGRVFVKPRDGDKKQARRRVNHLVESKLIPHPNAIDCVDCGHVWSDGERRHEYDHYLGYDGVNHENVQAVCSTCHAIRSGNEGHSNRGRSNGQSKLTATQVLQIRALYANGNITFKAIAELYSMNPQSISNIINRKKWKHI